MTKTNIDHELSQFNQLRDDDLEQVVGGSITRKIDASSPKLFENACSGTPFRS